MTSYRLLKLLLTLPVLYVAVISDGVAERLYKWVDANGNIQYSNRLPPEASQHERQEMNEQGRVLKIYSAPQTEEQKAEAKLLAELEAKRKARARKRAIYDRSLLATYSSVEDMRDAQNGKVTMIESLIQLTHSRVDSMQERLTTLAGEAARYERSGKPLPFTLKQQIQNLRDQIEHNRQFAADKEAEMVEIRAQFARDISRYEKLTGEKTLSASRRSPLEIALDNPGITLDRSDRALLTAFSSEEDLQFARNEDLARQDREIKSAFDLLEATQQKLVRLSDTASDYESAGKAPPDTLIEQIKSASAEVAAAERELQQERRKKLETEQKYATDLQRFRVLTASN